MRLYYVCDKPNSFWCIRDRFGFWSEFEESEKDRVKYIRFFAWIQIIIMRILTNDDIKPFMCEVQRK